MNMMEMFVKEFTKCHKVKNNKRNIIPNSQKVHRTSQQIEAEYINP